MRDPGNLSQQRPSGSVAAAAIVLMLGTVGCTVVMAIAGQDPVAAGLLFVGGLLLIGLMTWLLRTTPDLGAALYGWVRSRHVRPPEVHYEPTPRQHRSQSFGTNSPPSVEEVRELKEGLNTWVPQGSGRNSPRRRANPH